MGVEVSSRETSGVVSTSTSSVSDKAELMCVWADETAAAAQSDDPSSHL